MTKTYEKVGKGAFFENDTGGNDKRPRYKGNMEISGKEFDIALWPRVGKSGHKYMSMQINLKGAREAIGDGALFLRDQKSNRAPSLTGPIEIMERKFQGSVWPQKAENGTEYYRLKVELVTESEEG